ncbi:hypothetical protein ACIQXD_15335 [Streptomyces uncialis]|uniref:hypothetical protein n=1 Tax=Streptomyces uncialis TaxID=1048205 RepID=UPI0037F3634E
MRTLAGTGPGGQRRALRGTAAFGVAAALSLTGCGSGATDGGERAAPARSGTPAPSDRPSAPPAPATDTPAEDAPVTGATPRPDLTLPAGLVERFELWRAHDPDRDRAMADAGHAQTVVLDAIARGGTDTDALAFYFTGRALSAAKAHVRGVAGAGESRSGFVRYHRPELAMPDPRVDAPGKGTAALSFCADESELFREDRATGAVDRTQAGADAQIHYETRLRLSDKGVWQTYELATRRGVDTCAS